MEVSFSSDHILVSPGISAYSAVPVIFSNQHIEELKNNANDLTTLSFWSPWRYWSTFEIVLDFLELFDLFLVKVENPNRASLWSWMKVHLNMPWYKIHFWKKMSAVVAEMQIVFKVSIAKLNGISLLRQETHRVAPGLLRWWWWYSWHLKWRDVTELHSTHVQL